MSRGLIMMWCLWTHQVTALSSSAWEAFFFILREDEPVKYVVFSFVFKEISASKSLSALHLRWQSDRDQCHIRSVSTCYITVQHFQVRRVSKRKKKQANLHIFCERPGLTWTLKAVNHRVSLIPDWDEYELKHLVHIKPLHSKVLWISYRVHKTINSLK